MARFVLPFFLFFFCLVQLSAQKQWTVTGTVRGDQGELLVGASVFADNVFAVATDTLGRFSATFPKRPQQIMLRYLGYFAQIIDLRAADFRQNTANLEFQLVNQSPLLNEVTISAKPLETIIAEDFTIDLYDFGFAGSNILLLLREKKRFFLRLVDERGDILSQLRLPEECRLLHRSCMGDFHAVGKSWSWEVAINDTQVDTLSRYPAKQFYKFVAPCAQQSGGQFYFLQHGTLNQALRYMVFQEGKEPRVAFQIEDKKGMDNAVGALRDFFDNTPMVCRTPYWAKRKPETDEFEIIQPWEINASYNTVEGLTNLSGYDDDQIYRIAELEAIRCDSIYAPLLKINDTLCLFDHVHNNIVRFGPRVAETKVVPTTYHQEKGWKKMLLQDITTNRVFARFSNRNGLILKEISPMTGQVLKTMELELAPYISDKFKLKNGMLYFIGQPDVNTPNKMLYKMNIFAGVIR